MPAKIKKPLRFEYWKACSKALKVGEWYWHIRAPNGEIICQGESYKRKAGVLKVFHLLFDFDAVPECVDINAEAYAKFKKAVASERPKHFEGHLARNFP